MKIFKIIYIGVFTFINFYFMGDLINIYNQQPSATNPNILQATQYNTSVLMGLVGSFSIDIFSDIVMAGLFFFILSFFTKKG
jgi:hypothetical protein